MLSVIFIIGIIKTGFFKKLKYFKIKEIKINNVTLKADYKVFELIYKICVEMENRTITKQINEDFDSIEDIYNSRHNFFCFVRENIKEFPIEEYSKYKETISYINSMLNDVLRPHLTKYQKNFRWRLENNKPLYKNLSAIEIEKLYPFHAQIIAELKSTNEKLNEYKKTFNSLINELK